MLPCVAVHLREVELIYLGKAVQTARSGENKQAKTFLLIIGLEKCQSTILKSLCSIDGQLIQTFQA